MFARWARPTLHRCFHTRLSPSNPPPRFNRPSFALGVSAVAATFLTWHLTSDHYRIALDSPQAQGPGSKKTSLASTSSGVVLTGAETSTDPLKEEASSTSKESAKEASTKPEGSAVGQEQGQEEDASESNSNNGGAFNPETGEINWDCPCLGGMAYGPCGLQFREAFSCFVYSEAEPKGMDCVEKFKAMQDCFRAHPDIYADEIADDEPEPSSEETSSTEGGKDNAPPVHTQTQISLDDSKPASTASS